MRMSLYFHIFALYLCDFEAEVRGGKVVFIDHPDQKSLLFSMINLY